jgi:hypothetical protein
MITLLAAVQFYPSETAAITGKHLEKLSGPLSGRSTGILLFFSDRSAAVLTAADLQGQGDFATQCLLADDRFNL